MLKLTILNEAEITAIQDATLHILEETGILLKHPLAREVLAGNGATIHQESVSLPSQMVEKAIALAGKQVTLRGRDGKPCSLGDGSLHWHNLGGARDVFDFSSGQRRPAVVQDVRDSTRLLDALEGATTITPFFTPQDVPGEVMSLAMYRHALPHTTKPLHGPGVQNGKEVACAIRMASVIGLPEEMLSLSVSPVSPLTIPDDAAEAILTIAEKKIPFSPLPCPVAGTTAPMSLAGALAQQNAELLACIVLASCVQPGLPITYCGRLAVMEPRTGLSVWGGVELGLISAATVQIGHSYGFPVNVYGFSTNSHTLDLQSGFERALNAAIPALAGADELSGIGEMEAGVMGSYAQMVADSELAASIRRLKRGITVDEDALAVEVIDACLRGSHNFLAQPHTRRYLRSGEALLTRLAERGTWESWEQAGRQGLAERAQLEADSILDEHQVLPLSQDQERWLDEILDEAQHELCQAA